MSDFSSLTVGMSGLEANREALDIVGQNVSNSSTPGYTAERVNQVAVGGVQYPGFDESVPPLPGSGVQVTGVSRLTNDYLTARSLTEQANSGALTAQQNTLASIQQIFPEPGTNGIQGQLSSYWSAWGAVANQPDDSATRTALLEQGRSLATAFNLASSSLGTLSASTASQVATTVSSINNAATQIAQLNQSIRQGTLANLPVNELADQRDQLVSTLSNQLGVTTQTNADGTVDVFTGNQALVRGITSQSFTVSGSGTLTSLHWPDGSTFSPTSGQLGGMLSSLGTISSYQSQLDQVALALKNQVNAQQAQGVDLTGAAGVPFFSGTGAGDIAVAVTNPNQVAAASSSAPVPVNPTTGLPDPSKNLDGSNALAAGEMGAQANGPDVAYRQFITVLGNAAQQANTQLTAQTSVTASVNAALQAATGVNVDQELTNMLMYQHAYEASAKFVTTVDSMIQTLIGLVQ